MTDPRVLLRLQSARGRGLATMLRPGEAGLNIPARRGEIQAPRYSPNSASTRTDDGPINMQLIKVEPDEEQLDYGLLAAALKKKEWTFNADFGDMTEGTQLKYGYYNGVSTWNGTVTVTRPKGGPFVASRITTYTGYWKNGQPETDATVFAPGKDLSIKVKAGQEYRVTYAFNGTNLKPGSYTGTSEIDDGTLIHMAIKGNLVAAAGHLTVETGEGSIVSPGTQAITNLDVTGNGNAANTKAKVEILNQDELATKYAVQAAVAPKELSLKDGIKSLLKMSIVAKNGAADVDGSVHLRLTGYSGNAVTDAYVPFSVKTVWYDSGNIHQTAGNVTLDGRLRFNSAGYYEYTGVARTSSKVTNDDVIAFVFQDTPVNGGRPGEAVKFTLAAKYRPGPSTIPFTRTGTSDFIRDHFEELRASTTRQCLYVNDKEGAGKAAQGYAFVTL